MKSVGIIGASGYTGYELIKILKNHKGVELKVLNSSSNAGKKVSSLYKDYQGDDVFTSYSIDEINSMNLDLIFLATPNGVAMALAPKLNCKVVDLSADYRFKDSGRYEEIYGIKHQDNKKAVYGLPELFKEKIKKAKLVANPGCYVTSCILNALPIQKLAKYIIFDCKSGYSGAGKEPCYVNEPKNYQDNIIPYKISKHRHKYEIEQIIKTKLSFTPHVIATFQGLMCTAHYLLKENIGQEKIKEMYKGYYQSQPFVKIVDKLPELHDIQGTNYCCIGGFEIDENNQLVVISVIDNLIKGASGQAVQNMNLMLGFDEKEGLE